MCAKAYQPQAGFACRQDSCTSSGINLTAGWGGCGFGSIRIALSDTCFQLLFLRQALASVGIPLVAARASDQLCKSIRLFRFLLRTAFPISLAVFARLSYFSLRYIKALMDFHKQPGACG